MRGLEELVTTAAGRCFLAERGVFCNQENFRAHLAPPPRPALAELTGRPPDEPVVYVGHQLLADYRGSVVAKLRAARRLRGRGGPGVVMVWLDTDRAGADRGSMGLTWPGRPGQAARLAPRRLANRETRFVPVAGDDVERMLGQLRVWVADDLTGSVRERALQRLDALAGDLRAGQVATLAEADLGISRRLLADGVGADFPGVLVSRLATTAAFRAAVDAVLDSIDAVVDVFNDAVHRLRAAGIDPRVTPVDDGYLPLRYSCPRDGRRLPLHRERRGADHFAAAVCRCGSEHRFHLGSRQLRVDELAATGRWSTDVTLPVYLTDLASGVVAGRSSAVYGMVLNEVVANVLGRAPLPALVPPRLTADIAADSLMYHYLTAA